MKLTQLLFALILITAAGAAFAAQPATHSSDAPDPLETVGSDGEVPCLPAIDGLQMKPAEQSYVCFIDCTEERLSCLGQCPASGEPGWEACIDACYAEYAECTEAC